MFEFFCTPHWPVELLINIDCMSIQRPEIFDAGVADYVRREYRRGLTANGCIGQHGTSPEALKYLLAATC